MALRKARLLQKAGALIRLVAPEVSAELTSLVQESGGTVLLQPYEERHLQDVVLVISATDQPDINQQVSMDCRARKLPVNVVDNPKLCSVVMPAIVDRSPLMIGIGSGGEAPVLARVLRAQLESSIPAAYGRLAEFASRFRNAVKQRFTDDEQCQAHHFPVNIAHLPDLPIG